MTTFNGFYIGYGIFVFICLILLIIGTIYGYTDWGDGLIIGAVVGIVLSLFVALITKYLEENQKGV